MATDLAAKWDDIHGKNHWDGLLDPLDIDLRRRLLLYGDMAKSVMDTLNVEPASRNAGTSRFARRNLFERVGLSPHSCEPFPYQVTRYIYATATPGNMADKYFIKPWSSSGGSNVTNLIALVATATDKEKDAIGRRNIVVAWRGSATKFDWENDFDVRMVRAEGIVPSGRVHQGFFTMYTTPNPTPSPIFPTKSARDQMWDEIKRLMALYKDECVSVTVTGHSMGAAIATLSAADIAKNMTGATSRSCLVTGIVFASPRMGDGGFKETFDGLGNLRVLRVSNSLDIVPQVPIPLPILDYSHVGEELRVDSMESPYLKRPVEYHNLQVYLHTVAGTQGSRGGFKLEVPRDLALVNRDTEEGLKDEYHVPKGWWVPKNKGMLQDASGKWVLDDREDDPDP